jgi:hypothetical protein
MPPKMGQGSAFAGMTTKGEGKTTKGGNYNLVSTIRQNTIPLAREWLVWLNCDS